MPTAAVHRNELDAVICSTHVTLRPFCSPARLLNVKGLSACAVKSFLRRWFVQMASPMAGSFYRAPAPGEPAFCKEGDKVSKGQTVCIIEAMKLMNEIEVHSLTLSWFWIWWAISLGTA